MSELAPACRRALEERATPRVARALAVAAIRETHEETGLECGPVVDGALHPDLGAIEFFFRAITPTESPIRFHARFFWCPAERLHGGALRSNGELLDLEWFPIARARALPLIDVTEDALDEVERRVRGERPPRIPLFHYHRGARRLRR